MKRIVALVLAVTFCLPLAGCDEFTDNAYKVLKASDVAYQATMKSAAMAYKQQFITKDKLARITHFAEVYHGSWKTASTVLGEYAEAEQSGDEVAKSTARKVLETTLALMSRQLTTLQVYWHETREAYTKLKDTSNE